MATAVSLGDGRVLILGGWGLAGSGERIRLDSAEIYDPKTGTFAATGSMFAARLDPAAIALKDGRILVVGGSASGLEPAELYDPDTGRFTRTGSLKVNLEGFSATLLNDGRVLIAGGSTNPGIVKSAELYDPRTGEFTATASMTTPRTGHVAALLPDGRVLIAGGDFDVTSAELFDPLAEKFTPTGSMTTYRTGARATALGDGRVLVTGGTHSVPMGDISYDVDLATAELYDVRTGKFTPTGSMVTARSGHTATLLPSGMVLVFGGRLELGPAGDMDAKLRAAELYDPSAGTFSRTGAIATGRFWPAVASLRDGRVLITGGTDEAGYGIASAELYWP
jgi:hypothetical protein